MRFGRSRPLPQPSAQSVGKPPQQMVPNMPMVPGRPMMPGGGEIPQGPRAPMGSGLAQPDIKRMQAFKNMVSGIPMGNKPMKKGGKVKSASARADGCAVRGKTRA